MKKSESKKKLNELTKSEMENIFGGVRMKSIQVIVNNQIIVIYF